MNESAFSFVRLLLSLHGDAVEVQHDLIWAASVPPNVTTDTECLRFALRANLF